MDGAYPLVLPTTHGNFVFVDATGNEPQEAAAKTLTWRDFDAPQCRPVPRGKGDRTHRDGDEEHDGDDHDDDRNDNRGHR